MSWWNVQVLLCCYAGDNCEPLKEVPAEFSTVPPMNTPLDCNCLRKLGCDPHKVTLAGFRGGGATDHWQRLRKLASASTVWKVEWRRDLGKVRPRILDRLRCYAHWQCLLRHSSPLWSLVTGVLLVKHRQRADEKQARCPCQRSCDGMGRNARC